MASDAVDHLDPFGSPFPREMSKRGTTCRLVLPEGEVPLGFVQEGDRVFLVARERSSLWPTTILREGKATLRLPAGAVSGTTRLLGGDQEKEAVLALFREKYGEQRFLRWYDHPARIVEVLISPSHLASPDATSYSRWLEAEFDNVAADYDRHILGNRINRLLRDRSLAVLRSTFARAHRLLELGCGSGMETLPLLREGHEVACVDISPRMLEVVKEKARQEGLSERLTTRRLRVRDLAEEHPGWDAGSFDGAYSTYGALNCEPDLQRLRDALHLLLRPQGSFVAGVYNRWCLFEVLGYAATLQGRRALGRRHRPVPVGTSRFCVDVYSYTPGDFVRLFSPGFVPRRLEGVPVLLPPSDLAPYAERFSRHFARLARWDDALGSRWPWNHLGDHFLLTLQRS